MATTLALGRFAGWRVWLTDSGPPASLAVDRSQFADAFYPHK